MDPTLILLLSHLAFQTLPVCSPEDPRGMNILVHVLLPNCDKGDMTYGDGYHVQRDGKGGWHWTRCIARRPA